MSLRVPFISAQALSTGLVGHLRIYNRSRVSAMPQGLSLAQAKSEATPSGLACTRKSTFGDQLNTTHVVKLRLGHDWKGNERLTSATHVDDLPRHSHFPCSETFFRIQVSVPTGEATRRHLHSDPVALLEQHAG